MLDNLKLGYGGTKTEMERLIMDAEKLDGTFKATRDTNGKLTMSYADIVNAIHIVQTDLKISGITAEEAAELVASGAMTQEEAFELMGTTAKEASTTIQGSISSLKSAWQNLVTGFADPKADIGKLISNVTSSAKTVLSNLLPVIKQTLATASKAIASFVPDVAREIPGLLSDVIPDLMNAAESLVDVFVSSIPELLRLASDIVSRLAATITKAAPKFLKAGAQAILELGKGLKNGISGALSGIRTLIRSLVQICVEMLPEFLTLGAEIVTELVNGLSAELPALIDELVLILTNQDSLNKIIDAGIMLLSALVDGLPKIISAIAAALPKLIASIVTALTNGTLIKKIIDAGVVMLTALVRNASEIIKGIVLVLPDIVNAIVTTLTSGTLLQDIINAGVTLLVALVNNLGEIIDVIVGVLPSVVESIVTALTTGTLLQDVIDAGVTLLVALVSNINEIIEVVCAALPKIVTEIVDALTADDGYAITQIIHAGVTLLTALIRNIPAIIATICAELPHLVSSIYNELTKPANIAQFKRAGEALMKALWDGMKKIFASLGEWATGGLAGLAEKILGKNSTTATMLRAAEAAYKLDQEQEKPRPITNEEAVQAGLPVPVGPGDSSKHRTGILGTINVIDLDTKRKRTKNAPSGYVSVPLYASGTSFAERGWAITGERGPELVWFNGGEKVVNAAQTKAALGMSAAGEQQIIALLQAILEKTGAEIRLDDGTLVGYVDQRLGSMATRKARGN